MHTKNTEELESAYLTEKNSTVHGVEEVRSTNPASQHKIDPREKTAFGNAQEKARRLESSRVMDEAHECHL